MKWLKALMVPAILISSCTACDNNTGRNHTNDEVPDELTTENAEKSERIPERDALFLDTTYTADAGVLNTRNMRWFTYQYVDDESQTDENPVVRSNNRQEAQKIIHQEAIYEITEVSRPPLFNKNCLTAANPEQCSNEALLDWMQYAVEKPKRKEGLVHFVTFLIDERGDASAAQIISVQDKPACEPCIEATLEAIAGMPNWLPALRNLKPVKVQVTFPIHYD